MTRSMYVWRTYAKPFYATAKKWLGAHRGDILFALAWALVTWSAFLWNHRAWAASIGLYFFVDTLVPIVAEMVAAKREALKHQKDR